MHRFGIVHPEQSKLLSGVKHKHMPFVAKVTVHMHNTGTLTAISRRVKMYGQVALHFELLPRSTCKPMCIALMIVLFATRWRQH